MSELDETNTAKMETRLKAAMADYVIPVLLGVLGFLGTQIIDIGKGMRSDLTALTATVEEKTQKNALAVSALRGAVDDNTDEINRLRDKE